MDVGEKRTTSLKITPPTPHSQQAESLGQEMKWLKENLDLTITHNIQIALQDKKAPVSYLRMLSCQLSFKAWLLTFLDSYKKQFLFLICGWHLLIPENINPHHTSGATVY